MLRLETCPRSVVDRAEPGGDQTHRTSGGRWCSPRSSGPPSANGGGRGVSRQGKLARLRATAPTLCGDQNRILQVRRAAEEILARIRLEVVSRMTQSRYARPKLRSG